MNFKAACEIAEIMLHKRPADLAQGAHKMAIAMARDACRNRGVRAKPLKTFNATGGTQGRIGGTQGRIVALKAV